VQRSASARDAVAEVFEFSGKARVGTADDFSDVVASHLSRRGSEHPPRIRTDPRKLHMAKKKATRKKAAKKATKKAATKKKATRKKSAKKGTKKAGGRKKATRKKAAAKA
jgi:hypothetical protein